MRLPRAAATAAPQSLPRIRRPPLAIPKTRNPARATTPTAPHSPRPSPTRPPPLSARPPWRPRRFCRPPALLSKQPLNRSSSSSSSTCSETQQRQPLNSSSNHTPPPANKLPDVIPRPRQSVRNLNSTTLAILRKHASVSTTAAYCYHNHHPGAGAAAPRRAADSSRPIHTLTSASHTAASIQTELLHSRSQTSGTTRATPPGNISHHQPRPTPYLTRSKHTMSDQRDPKRARVAAAEGEHLPAGITETDEELQKHWFVGSIDQGTTSTRFLIFNGLGDPVAMHQIEFENHYPHSGWHEHDPLELLSSVEECISAALAKFTALGHPASAIRGVGITNQRETTVLWDARTGEPLHNAIVWPDTRTAPLVRDLRARPGADALQPLCGLPLSTYPSSVKLRWALDNLPRVRDAYDAGHLAFGTVDSWLIYRLNGGASASPAPIHVTDSTNASRTMFMNLHTLKYDPALLSFFDIDPAKIALPKIVPSSHPTAFGKLASGPLAGVPIAGCLGDQSSALVGQCGFLPGQAKNTYGTGCFLLYNVGHEPVISKSGLLATVAYDFGNGRKPVYALEGSIAVAGSGVKFLVKNLNFVPDATRISDLAASVPDNGGVVFVTAFSGLFAPYWIDDAKGTLFGITQHTQKGHIARATLEATCYQTKAILDAMAKDSGHALESLAVDGGLSNSDLCMQAQADISGIRVDRPAMRETTALGAAIAAGLALGVWNELDDLKNVNQSGRKVFTPSAEREKNLKMFKKWEQAVEMSRGWVRDNLE